jgi:erythromycin esterase-like protein
MSFESVVESIRLIRRDTPQDYDPILNSIGDASVVLIGDASHGTHEFYKIRAEITKRLIMEKGFSVICCEADWSDMYRVNQYVKNTTTIDRNAEQALGNFQRFPRWMWRNTDVLYFVEWLKRYNEKQMTVAPSYDKVGIYGLDLYSLLSSMNEVVQYLERTDPRLAEIAKQEYACFDNMDSKAYGRKAGLG